jgi:hypothetical protein
LEEEGDFFLDQQQVGLIENLEKKLHWCLMRAHMMDLELALFLTQVVPTMQL